VNPSYLLAWIPETLLNEKGKTEWEKFTKVEEHPGLDDEDEGTHAIIPHPMMPTFPQMLS
jgi:hypothetical protein